MKEIIVEIKNGQGLHLRPSSEIVNTVRKYKSTLAVRKNGETVKGNNVMGLMSLGASEGEELLLTADGDDEDELLDELRELIEVNKFFED